MAVDPTYPSSFQVRQDGNAVVPSGKSLDVESGGSLKLAGTAIAATAAELDRACDVSGRLVAAGSVLTLTEAAHDGKTILLDTAAGSTITLPAAAGSGARFRLVVSVTPTSNQHRINVVGNDAFFGMAVVAQDGGDTVVVFEAGADADQINLNGTTTGGIKGAVVELEDIATDSWAVQIRTAASGTEATPFATGQVS